ncbi:MAG: hypothetical protein JRF41_03845, partial [Deltaproteobacteria bacterium]|nr:hypothetical protein [Deltaproteobacteria bacterium]
MNPSLNKYNIKPGNWKPDFERFRQAVTTNQPGPVPMGDLFADPGTMSALLGEKVESFLRFMARNSRSSDTPTDETIAAGLNFLKQSVNFYEAVGWDFVTSHGLLNFPGFRMHLASESEEEIKGGRRAYIESDSGPITSWEDFASYQWPESPGVINLGAKVLNDMVPEGMKVMVLPGGLFEWTTWLMGTVQFSYALYDQPDLVDAVIEKLSDIIYKGAEELMTLSNFGGLFIGDDMGFYSGTLVSPKILREKFLPHLKKMVDLAHKFDKLALLHSCGNLEAIMDDIIETGVDGKHSFEDKIMPVEEAYRRWGDKIGIIGGLDVNLLASGTEDEVRKRTRQILDACGQNGHYVLGTGNSVASYITLENYLAMLDEGRKWNK